MLNLNTPLRTIQGLLAIIALGLNGYGKPHPRSPQRAPTTQHMYQQTNKLTNVRNSNILVPRTHPPFHRPPRIPLPSLLRRLDSLPPSL